MSTIWQRKVYYSADMQQVCRAHCSRPTMPYLLLNYQKKICHHWWLLPLNQTCTWFNGSCHESSPSCVCARKFTGLEKHSEGWDDLCLPWSMHGSQRACTLSCDLKREWGTEDLTSWCTQALGKASSMWLCAIRFHGPECPFWWYNELSSACFHCAVRLHALWYATWGCLGPCPSFGLSSGCNSSGIDAYCFWTKHVHPPMMVVTNHLLGLLVQ